MFNILTYDQNRKIGSFSVQLWRSDISRSFITHEKGMRYDLEVTLMANSRESTKNRSTIQKLSGFYLVFFLVTYRWHPDGSTDDT